MSRIDAEWIVAHAIVRAGIRSARVVIRECPLNVGKELLMKRCKTCGREYYSDCLDCTFRSGHTIPEVEENYSADLVDWMSRPFGIRVASLA